VIGLPDTVEGCLFDLDGVLTATAKVHAAAWKQMFDEFLSGRGERPFDEHHDYDEYVDGKPRLDGVRSFLASRGIELPESEVDALGNRKNELFLRTLREEGVDVYPGSVRFVEAARDAGLRRAVVSSSANCLEILTAAGILGLFESIVDGNVRRREQLHGKPAPDTFLYAARALGLGAPQAAVFEDALAGVASGRAGEFGLVVGVDRVGQAEALREHGADVVVSDLAELLA
jgi:beta-phosphoglucomutase family hydrolase